MHWRVSIMEAPSVVVLGVAVVAAPLTDLGPVSGIPWTPTN